MSGHLTYETLTGEKRVRDDDVYVSWLIDECVYLLCCLLKMVAGMIVTLALHTQQSGHRDEVRSDDRVE